MAYNDRYRRFPTGSTGVCAVCYTQMGDTSEAVCSESCQEVADMRQSWTADEEDLYV